MEVENGENQYANKRKNDTVGCEGIIFPEVQSQDLVRKTIESYSNHFHWLFEYFGEDKSNLMLITKLITRDTTDVRKPPSLLDFLKKIN